MSNAYNGTTQMITIVIYKSVVGLSQKKNQKNVNIHLSQLIF